MEVTLKCHSPLNIAVQAALICTGNLKAWPKYDMQKFLTSLLSKGHESVIEHISYTFLIEGVSRALLLELERHRHASMSVESTRWALKKLNKEKALNNVLSDVMSSYVNDTQLTFDQRCAVENVLFTSDLFYGALHTMIEAGVPNDVVKYFLPEATCTNLFYTVNARELRHICKLRSQNNVLPEFRELVDHFIEAVPSGHRFLFAYNK